MSASLIDAATQAAYAETQYEVQGAAPFTLQIGRANLALQALHRQYQVSCSAYLTACNPFSRALSAAENAQRQAALDAELLARGLVHIAGEGRHSFNGWPAEASWLVLGLSMDDACALGRRLDQNAIVWSGPDAVPQLILLR